MDIKDTVLKYLKHLGFVALLAAANVVLLSFLASVNAFNVTSLPENLQQVAYLLVPALVLIVSNVQKQIALELSQENEAKAKTALAVSESKNFR